jgi:hypothetical protein
MEHVMGAHQTYGLYDRPALLDNHRIKIFNPVHENL